ncbi:DUF4829 domain-containing protein [Thermoanaerobacterium saccharolyticum]|uniref:DUF4830 domain-containing protein n=1 Tax=Thermoanaerobacterium saccharolyticum TaxID=28896 RepID=UPI002FDB49EF
MKKFLIFVCIALAMFLTACSGSQFNVYNDDTKFLLKYGFSPEKESPYFDVTIPSDWKIQSTSMPIGLYWTEVNFLSRDIGYNIEKYKGKTVKAVIYSLNEKLPGQGESSKYTYPVNAVILRDGENIIGAWLEFNASTPLSLKKNYIETLTEKPWIDWVASHGFLKELSSPAVDKLTPEELIYAYFNGINKGDKGIIYSTLSIDTLHDMLYINRPAGVLYNTDFESNSLELNTKSATVLNIAESKSYVPVKNRNIYESKEYKVTVNLSLKSEDNVSIRSGKNTFFFIISKSTKDSPWKIESIGTGP